MTRTTTSAGSVSRTILECILSIDASNESRTIGKVHQCLSKASTSDNTSFKSTASSSLYELQYTYVRPELSDILQIPGLWTGL